VEIVEGNFMFVNFDKFKEMDYFYPNTFLYVEERFIAFKTKQLGLNNYVLSDETYIHERSKTIDATYGVVDKYRMLYDGWIEYTRVCRSCGKLKVAILKPLIAISLIEIRLVYGWLDLKNRLKKNR
jgi:GT2 family glycosyltransferase